MKIIMLGAPGAGKGTQAKKIAAQYSIPHISTGDIFRANIKNNTELGQKAKTYMDKGELVPDSLVVDLIMDRFKEADCANGYVLDGFPRTIPQAEALDNALKANGEKVDFAINVEVPDENIINRMSGRRACVGCGATYHIKYNPTKVEGVCDACGEKLILRDDDKPETVKNRLSVYHEQTQPLIDYYNKAGVLAEVDGTKDMEGTRLYWSVQAKLLQLDDKNNTSISLLLRFEHTGNTLRLYEPYIYNRLEGDKPLNDVTLLAPYGINALEESCEVEALSSSKMILKTPSLRLKFKKSN